MNIRYDQIIKTFFYSAHYVPITLLIAFVPVVLGLIFGSLIAIGRIYRVKIVSPILDFIVLFINALPGPIIILVLITVFNQGFDSFAKMLHLAIRAKNVNVIYVGILAMTIISIPALSESIRGALLSIDQGQYEAGYSVGLSKFQVLQRIVLPQAFLVLIPTLCGDVIGTLKGSSFLFIIGVMDIINSALKFATSSYCILEAYIAAALLYWLMSIFIENIFRLLEHQMGKHRRVLG